MARRRRSLPADTDIVSYLISLPPERRAEAVRMWDIVEAGAFDQEWREWAHDGQEEPRGDWRTWVIMAGRGFGKTLAGAQWVAACVMGGSGRLPRSPTLSPEGGREPEPLRIALVGATIDEARRIMIDGKSGLMEVAGDLIAGWYPTRRLLRFKNGAEATLFSGASPDALRGPEHHIAWCDELAKWEKPGETWDMLQLGLRLGERPRALVTTTPRPGPVLGRIMAGNDYVRTGGPMRANPHLPDAFKENVETLYAGTRLGRQELDGELLTDAAGALWTVELLERCRSVGQEGEAACFEQVVIGVDPPSGDGTCGIVVCARDDEGIAHVLADHSVTARSPEGWARAVAHAAAVHFSEEEDQAPLVVAEANQGGKMVATVLRIADPELRAKLVTAVQGKSARADPVALLFEAGKVVLHGRFAELEAELLGMIAGGDYEGPGASPDRADALVWALTELMLGKRRAPRVRRL